MEINPQQAEAWGNKGLLEDKLGRSMDAVRSYRKFIELAPAQYARQIEFAHRRLLELKDR